jgi:hypothetical protein
VLNTFVRFYCRNIDAAPPRLIDLYRHSDGNAYYLPHRAVARSLGFPEAFLLPADPIMSYQMLGNSMSPAMVFIWVEAALRLLGCPFSSPVCRLHDLLLSAVSPEFLSPSTHCCLINTSIRPVECLVSHASQVSGLSMDLVRLLYIAEIPMHSELLQLLHNAHIETAQALRDFPSFEQLVSAVECRNLGLHIVALSPFRDSLRMVHNLACPTTRMAPLLKVCKVARATVLHDVDCVWHRIENATHTGSTFKDIFVSYNGSEVDIADLLLSFGARTSSVFPVFVLPPVLRREYPEMFERSPRARSFLSSRVALDRHPPKLEGADHWLLLFLP